MTVEPMLSSCCCCSRRAVPVSLPLPEIRSSVAARPLLETTVNRFQPIQGIQELQARLLALYGINADPFSNLDRKSNPLYRNSSLIGHLELGGRRSIKDLRFNDRENFFRKFGARHEFPPGTLFLTR